MDAKSDTLKRLRLPEASDELFQCPSCDVKLRTCEVAQHCEQELVRLRQLHLKRRSATTTSSTENATDEVASNSGRKPWSVFQRVQRNRQSRQKQRTRKRLAPPIEQLCPVCNLSYPLSEIQRHAEQCLRSNNGANNGRDDNSSDDDGDDGDEYEEYEWAGQKRIRVSSLLQGGYAAIGVGTGGVGVGSVAEEDEEDLNVDEDDTQIYGPAQYGEGDVIPTTHTSTEHGVATTEDDDVTSYMRRLITGQAAATLEPTDTSGINADNKTNINNIPNIDGFPSDLEAGTSASTSVTLVEATKSSSSSTPKSVQHLQQIIEALKAKLRHQEQHVQSKFKCLICLDDYRNPAISVACWHVHCEACWLRSLSARKLCPQCNLITLPKDLRRIYM